MPFRWIENKAFLRWGLIAAVWTLIGLTFAAQIFFASAHFGNPITWRRAVTSSLADWYLYAALSAPALWLVRRLPLEDPQFWRNLTVHLMASGVFSVAYMALRSWVGQWQNEQPISFAAVFSPLVVRTFHFNMLVYWAIVGLSGSLRYYQKFREREVRAAELEKLLAESRLQALQMQLNPHFLFNTLNAIASLMHRDVEAADRMLVRLSELLRMALESVQTQEVPLREELRFLSRYLEIERIRFGGRLEIEMNMPPDTLDLLVPNLVLQPLVENALRHGLQTRAGPGRLALAARRENGTLLLTVQDNGCGLPKDRPLREGIGLSNTRARLSQLYGAQHSLRLEPAPGGGVVVELRLPVRHTPASQTPPSHETPHLDRG